MFKMGDIIVYGAQGICKIESTQQKQIGKTTANYYVLKPLFNENASVFVPVDNTTLTNKMKEALTKAQADELAQKISDIDVLNFSDMNEKQSGYRAALLSGDCEKLVELIKTIRAERELRRENSKKLNISDEQTLRKAEILFYSQLAFAYGVSPDEVKNIINF